jgi:acetyl-CoA C-acetyltransferase
VKGVDTARLEETTPVLVGYGAAHQRAGDHHETLDAAGLMIEATRAALPSTLVGSVLPQVDWVGATEGLTPYPDPGRLVADAVGAVKAHSVLAKVGVMQQTLISRACSLVQSGDASLALVVGGEARYRDVVARAAGVEARITTQAADARPDEVLTPATEIVLRCEVDAGLRGAPPFYALIESEWRARRGQSLDLERRELGHLYARFSDIAADNPAAVRPQAYSADYLRSPSPGNPFVAFPYTKLMVTTWTVDQAAALLFCTAATAERLGIPRDRWIFPVIAIESNHMVPVTARKQLSQPEAVGAMARACTRVTGIDPAAIDLLDLYSCFPVAVTVAAHGLGIPSGRDLTLTGGMSFAGGPYNNYVFQALCRAADLLASGQGKTALVSCVSGLYTKQGFTVLAIESPPNPFSVQDVTVEVDELEPALPVEDRPMGPGTILAATVLFDGGTPERAVAVIDLPNGHRTVARCMEADVMTSFMTEEPVGRSVTVADGHFALAT